MLKFNLCLQKSKKGCIFVPDNKTKTEIMTTLQNKTGLTRVALEQMYINYVNALIDLGATEEQARKMVQETLKETINA